jgi:molybdopterin converting factor small subunit
MIQVMNSTQKKRSYVEEEDEGETDPRLLQMLREKLTETELEEELEADNVLNLVHIQKKEYKHL